MENYHFPHRPTFMRQIPNSANATTAAQSHGNDFSPNIARNRAPFVSIVTCVYEGDPPAVFTGNCAPGSQYTRNKKKMGTTVTTVQCR